MVCRIEFKKKGYPSFYFNADEIIITMIVNGLPSGNFKSDLSDLVCPVNFFDYLQPEEVRIQYRDSEWKVGLTALHMKNDRIGFLSITGEFVILEQKTISVDEPCDYDDVYNNRFRYLSNLSEV